MHSPLAPLTLAAALLAALPAFAEPEGARVARGMTLLKMQGCTACHSLDGSVSAGPTFAGRYGGEVRVRADGQTQTRTFDRSYLRSSLEAPEEAQALGFAPGVMPRFALTDEQIDAMAAALQYLARAPAGDRDRAPRALWLGLGLLCLVALGAGFGVAHGRRRKTSLPS